MEALLSLDYGLIVMERSPIYPIYRSFALIATEKKEANF